MGTGVGTEVSTQVGSRDGRVVNYQRIEFNLNDTEVAVDAEPTAWFLDVLRGQLGLTGTKQGCDYEGQCGTCTVVVNGRAVRACRTRMEQVARARVRTIEGLVSRAGLHPLQQAFIDTGAVQCGFCTPGMIMAAYALLERNPDPTEAEIVRGLQGNLCRCTGYVKIIDAVGAAARVMRGAEHSLRMPPDAIGGDLRRLNEIGKVTGETQYAADVLMPDMLHVQVLHSPHPHARLLEIDTQAAQALPGVRGVLTARDIPGVKSFPDNLDLKDGQADWLTNRAREPVLAVDRVRMVGEPVALVVANTEAAARTGVGAIRVTYEVLEPVFEADRALSPDAQRLHPHGNEYEFERISKGDASTVMEMADVCIESTCRLSSHDHLTLEPTSAVAYVDEEDTLTVLGPTQQPHLRKVQIAEMLAISPEHVRVIVPEMGGSFGGRHHFWPVLAIALPAYLLRQPVRLVYTRREDLQTTLKRHPFDFHSQIGARRDGALLGLRARAMGNAGPYGGAPGIAALVAQSGVGPYRWPAIDYECRIGHTNWANAGAFRGYGMPQGAFALETSLDELATALDMDPLELRLVNAIDNETGSALGHRFDEPFALREVLVALRPEWEGIRESTRALRCSACSTDLFGAGLATSWYQFSKVGALRMSAQAGLDLDGRITLYYTALRSGQGLDTVMSQIASHELGIPRLAVALVNADTDQTPHDDAYGGCRSTYWVGGAVQQAVRALKEAILDTASGMLGVSADRLTISERSVHVAGVPARAVALSDIAAEWQKAGRPLRYSGVLDLTHRLTDTDGVNMLGHFVVGAAAAQVRVDVRNGRVDVLRVTIAQDVGRAINPIDLEGQIQGAVMMELGATLMEEYVPGDTLDLKDYRIPRTRDVPEITVLMLETGGRDGPFGAKGVGEAVMGHTRAAIANAIHDAAGIRIRQLPATPERILEALGRLQSTSTAGG